jgi:hypothetical protein
MRAEEYVKAARRLLPIQQWRDETIWQRQATRIYYIFLSEPDAKSVPAVEAAVLLAVPFVYETVLAVAEARLTAAEALPDPDVAHTVGYLTSAWRNAWHNSDAAPIRRALVSRGKIEAADDFSCWSVVNFCHASSELWDAQGGAEGRTGWVFDAISSLVSPAPLSEVLDDRRTCEVLSAARLLRLARLMFASFDDVTLDATGNNRLLDAQVSTGEFTTQLILNEVRLAHLLNMGSQLALDPRRMPSLLAEHVGVDAMLSAKWIREQLGRAEWHGRSPDAFGRSAGRRWFDLKLDCPNDAVDAALLEVVNSIENYRTRLLQRQDIHFDATHDLLPAGLTANKLNAEPSGWRPVRPPLRFELDRSRIISLLMGQQLYGESWPALREVYQNALDACRYRRAMENLAVHDGSARSGRNYQARILIRFGSDAGRRFVEYVDNGIGMADHHVRRLFANAGRRFTDSHEFHIDRARWEEAGIKFYANSRFGVGVLSYFMLAEELDIASRRCVPSAHPGFLPVCARVLGSGSLFRKESTIDPTRLIDDYGTSVRLYLREDAPDTETLVQTILSWLFLPEVPVTIRTDTGRDFHLAEGQPTPTFVARVGDVLLPVRGSEDAQGNVRLYIAPFIDGGSFDPRKQDQVVLVDGIATSLIGRPWAHVLIVNLKEELRSSLTVDRRRVELTAAEAEPIHRWVEQNVGAASVSWEKPDFLKLHRTLRGLPPETTGAANIAIRSLKAPVVMRVPKLDVIWPLSNAGICDIDPEIVAELVNASRKDVIREIQSFLPRSELFDLRELVLRYRGSTHPVLANALAARVMELSDAGLPIPAPLLQAASFEMSDGERKYDARSGPVLSIVNATGRIGVSEVLCWIERDCLIVVDTARKIGEWWPSLLRFEFDKLDDIDPMCRRLMSLARGDELGWLELVYFRDFENINLDAVLGLARKVSEYGVSIPNLSAPPDDLRLDPAEYEFLQQNLIELEKCFRLDPVGPKLGLRTFVGDDFDKRERMEQRFIERNLIHEDYFMRDVSQANWASLQRKQRIMASLSGDGEAPFYKVINLTNIYQTSYSGKFGTIREAAIVARSLADFGFRVKIGSILDVDNQTLAKYEELNLAQYGNFLVSRFFDALDRDRPVTVWDLGLLAAAEGIEPGALSPLIDLLEESGGDVGRCREFLRFCSTH